MRRMIASVPAALPAMLAGLGCLSPKPEALCNIGAVSFSVGFGPPASIFISRTLRSNLVNYSGLLYYSGIRNEISLSPQICSKESHNRCPRPRNGNSLAMCEPSNQTRHRPTSEPVPTGLGLSGFTFSKVACDPGIFREACCAEGFVRAESAATFRQAAIPAATLCLG